jgi:hypothetical protein
MTASSESFLLLRDIDRSITTNPSNPIAATIATVANVVPSNGKILLGNRKAYCRRDFDSD